MKLKEIAKNTELAKRFQTVLFIVILMPYLVYASNEKIEHELKDAVTALQNKDFGYAYKIFKKHAKSGNAQAQLYLGALYLDGFGVRRNQKKAIMWIRRSVDQNNTQAMLMLADMHKLGIGVKKDKNLRLKWIRKAIEQGDNAAIYLLADMHRYGDGVDKDQAMALSLYRQAATKGNIEAQYELGRLLFWDEYELQGMKNALVNLGVKKQSDTNSPKRSQSEIEEGVGWLRKAANNGLPDAQIIMGKMFLKGRGVDKSAEKALLWYRKAADQGISQAMVEIGSMYEEGRVIPKNVVEAKNWYVRAAELGDTNAQFMLSRLYRFGKGVPKDLVTSYMWEFISVRNSVSSIKKMTLDSAHKELTQEQIDQALDRAQAWIESKNK